jgi:hypothetical protein
MTLQGSAAADFSDWAKETIYRRLGTEFDATMIIHERDQNSAIVTVDDAFFGGQVNEYPINYCPFCGKPLERDGQKE